MEQSTITKHNEPTLVLDIDGTMMPLFSGTVADILNENLPEDQDTWLKSISSKPPKINSIISSACGAAFAELVGMAKATHADDIDCLIANIERNKPTEEYDWWFSDTPAKYIKAFDDLNATLAKVLGWETYVKIHIKYLLLDDIAYPQQCLLKYLTAQKCLPDIDMQKMGTTCFITKELFKTYPSLEPYRALRETIRNQTQWSKIIIWTLSLYGKEIGMLLGIDSNRSFDTLALTEGQPFTVYSKKDKVGLDRFCEVAQVDPAMCVLVDDTPANVKNFGQGWIVNKLTPANSGEFNTGGKLITTICSIINGDLPLNGVTVMPQ